MEKNRFVVNGDGTITDTTTGLMWQQETAGPMPWEKAYSSSLFLGGHNDWREPTIKELQSIVEYTRFNPAIDTTAFPGTKSCFYWSSSTCASNTYDVWCVYFASGYISHSHKSSSYYVRAVRGGNDISKRV